MSAIVISKVTRGLLQGWRGWRIHCLCLALFVGTLAGCTALPPGTGLNSPRPAERTLPRKAWIGTVTISDQALKNPSHLENSLRAYISKFVRDGGFFLETGYVPDEIDDEDFVLDFRFNRYILGSHVHRAFPPFTLFTGPVYTLLGGPINVVESVLLGTVEIRDGAGHWLAEVYAPVLDEHNLSLWSWSPVYVLPCGRKERTSLIQNLVNKAHAAIRKEIDR